MKKLFLLSLILLLGLSSYALNPSRTYKQRPEKYNMKYEEFRIPTLDGSAELNVWFFPAKTKNKNLVLISHNGEGNMADYLRRVDQFLGLGYSVVIYDYRGFGESSEFEIDNNMYIYPHFLDDMSTMITWCRRNRVPTFSLYGWGLGAGLSLGVGYTRPEILRIIADTPFLSMDDLEERFEKWDEPLEVPFAGYDKKYEPLFALDANPQKNLTGIHLIIGSDDILFTLEDMQSLQSKRRKLFNGKPQVIVNPDQKDNFRADKVGYFKAIGTFLQR